MTKSLYLIDNGFLPNIVENLVDIPIISIDTFCTILYEIYCKEFVNCNQFCVVKIK